jgi:hypothetical protein
LLLALEDFLAIVMREVIVHLTAQLPEQAALVKVMQELF